ncbi:uncharacterized protein PGTG_03192 [Puccinia graminis f. sp. tritici CRL 75-36-700-3]|uniref:Uncharacterized protein n=1 Tax=Puccinia graminis f. sp. tritici (strain CRL 75-36-700-3 / race SCCL) TaxID=418459 RepID=E3JYW1_PUCGT|nr:uncharacterized protein PGTG_03192 [Puccinia graminis f. sp. tritici CRL 75-36-700-3]EFP77236.2 hypothetical protein PGTG_03192 [Puccinia graminis f. sp. tritici CRL 75-36-700-3]
MTMRIKKDQEIELNRATAKLCQLLDQSVSHLKASSSSSTNQDLNSLTPRITGGWLLGVQSNNLDIAILSSTGQDFATRFSSYMRDQQQLKREGQSENQETRSQPSRPGPIRANILKLPPLPSLAWNSTLPNSEARNTAIRIVASQAQSLVFFCLSVPHFFYLLKIASDSSS